MKVKMFKIYQKMLRTFKQKESMSKGEKYSNCRTWIAPLSGFTLAEVLITLGIIGVVASMTIPTLYANINERMNSERQVNIVHKITKAMEKMRALGELDGSYGSTDDFVDVLQKHLKIAKRCYYDHISDCWPTKYVTMASGENFDVSNAITGENLNIPLNNTHNVGIVMADGASIILTYNQNSGGIDVGDRVTASTKRLPIGGGKEKEYAYTTSVTNSIDFIMDVNGQKGPNSEPKNHKVYDIRSFKIASFSKGCMGIRVGKYCFVDFGDDYGCDEQMTEDCFLGAGFKCSNNSMHMVKYEEFKTIEPYLPLGRVYWVEYVDNTCAIGMGCISTNTKPPKPSNNVLCVSDK